MTTFLNFPRLATPALCATEGRPDDWFDGELARARTICQRCPSLDPCKSYALAHSVVGVWGGLDDDERREIREGVRVKRRRRTHCTNGHLFTAENTQQQRNGRRCRTCHNQRQADSKRRAS